MLVACRSVCLVAYLAWVQLYGTVPLVFTAVSNVVSTRSSTGNDTDAFSGLFKDAPFVVFFGLYEKKDSTIPFVKKKIQLFSSRFQYMSTWLSSEVSERNRAKFIALSEYNKEASANIDTKPIGLYPFCVSNDNFQTTFDSLLPVADSANAVFNDTVRYIILAGFFPTLQSDLENVDYAISKMNSRSPQYQIGVSLAVINCQTQASEIFRRIPSISLLVFKIKWEESFYIIGVDKALRQVTTTIATCYRNVNSIRSTVTLGFEVTWPDINSVGTIRNQTALSLFWISLAALAKKENFTIFIDQAFDAPGNRRVTDSNGGWTADFKEKISAPVDNLVTSTLERDSLSSSEIQYIRNNETSVNFNKILMTMLLDKAFTDSQYIPILDIIGDRFAKVMIKVQEDNLDTRNKKINEQESADLRLLKAVAIRNKILTSGEKSHRSVIQLNVGIDVNVTNENWGNEENLLMLVSMVAHINDISNGTVGFIVIYLHQKVSEESDLTETNEALYKVHDIIRTHNLKLGIITSAAQLDEQQLEQQDWLQLIYSISDVAYLRYIICEERKTKSLLADSKDMSGILEYVFGKHDRLLATIKDDAKKPGVYIDLNWANCNGYQVTHAHAGKFWLEANKMAEDRNLELLIGPAISLDSRRFAEWWRFDDLGRNYVMKEYEADFTEETSQAATPHIWVGAGIIICIMVLMSIGCLGLSIKWLRKRSHVNVFKQEEVKFLKGTREKQTKPIIPGNNVTEHLSNVAYDDSMEISSSSFSFENSSHLGSGAFGSVSLAEVKQNGKKIWSAVKSLHCNETKQATALRSLLMEIKILGYLGKHENITQLIGAYTSEISKGKVYIFLELCELGSLHGYLRRIGLSQEMDNLGPPSSQELMKWSIEIANGMEHISSKHIVHADLATRNVLLDASKTAKICDFGLSRRMENYQNYVKTSNEPLPWRWMAYESLTNMNFSTKSDVWSYGITLWEIFSRGKVPYPGLAWTCGFTETLESGFRLSKPKEANYKLYRLMASCWHIEPDRRPNFGAICNILKEDNNELLGPFDLTTDPVTSSYVNTLPNDLYLNGGYSNDIRLPFESLPFK